MGAIPYDHREGAVAQAINSPGDSLDFQQNSVPIASVIVNDPGTLDSLEIIRYSGLVPGFIESDVRAIPAYFAIFPYPESSFYDLDLLLSYSSAELDSAGISNEDSLRLYRTDISPLSWQLYPRDMTFPDPLNQIVRASEVNSLSLWTIVGDTLSIGGCAYLPGDINDNGQANGVDVSYGVNYFKGYGNAPPVMCPDCPDPGQNLYAAGDVNGNCQFNGVDITYFVNFLKGLGPALTYCESCPPASFSPPAPAVEPTKPPVLKAKGELRTQE